jgi:hypothetical protein
MEQHGTTRLPERLQDGHTVEDDAWGTHCVILEAKEKVTRLVKKEGYGTYPPRVM